MRYYYRPKPYGIVLMIISVLLVLISVVIESAFPGQSGLLSHLSLVMAAIGVIGGFAGFAVCRRTG